MITCEVIALSLLVIVSGVGAIIILILGLYTIFTELDIDKDMYITMIFTFLFACAVCGLVLPIIYKEYRDTIPENQVKILRQKITDAEKEYQEYLINHPELKENE